MRAATLTVRTPEGIVFSLPLAGPVTRFLAWTVDLACVATAITIATSLFAPLGLLSLDLEQAVLALAYVALSIGYGMAAEWLWRGQTVGKWLLRLRVVDEQGLKLRPEQVVVRNLLRFVDALPMFYFVGGAAVFLGRRAQRLGDLAAGTVVVRAAPRREPNLETLLAGKYNSLRGHAHLEARLRQRVTTDEAALALRALLRRDGLDPVARVGLFGAIAGHFRSLVDFPAETTESLTDEQYVRNVVDIVFRTRAGAAGGPQVASGAGAGGPKGPIAPGGSADSGAQAAL